jgi:hypothetical protein
MESPLRSVPDRCAAECRRFIVDQIRLAADPGFVAGGAPLASALLATTPGRAFIGFDPALFIEQAGRTFENGRWPQGRSPGGDTESVKAFAQAISGWLDQTPGGVLLLEDVLARVSDPGMKADIGKPSASFCAETIYEHRTAGASVDEIEASLHHQFPYPGIGVLTIASAPLPKELSPDQIRDMARAARALTIRAFDGESVVLATVEGVEPPAFLAPA